MGVGARERDGRRGTSFRVDPVEGIDGAPPAEGSGIGSRTSAGSYVVAAVVHGCSGDIPWGVGTHKGSPVACRERVLGRVVAGRLNRRARVNLHDTATVGIDAAVTANPRRHYSRCCRRGSRRTPSTCRPPTDCAWRSSRRPTCSWWQARPSRIVFGNVWTRAWPPRDGYEDQSELHADVYVFAVQEFALVAHIRDTSLHGPVDTRLMQFSTVPQMALAFQGANSRSFRRCAP
ncbi:hypothetical protein BH24ACT15_BH24ACT15_05400 [soil metagenome]